MHDLLTGMAEPLPGNASGPAHWHWPSVPSPPPGYCWDQSEPPPTIPANDTPQTHIYTNTQGKDNRNTHTGMNRGEMDNTHNYGQGDTEKHKKKMCTRRKWAHRKEGREEGRKSKTDIPHKQTQKDLNQVQKSCEKLLKRKCRKTKQHKTRWDIGKHAATETQTYRWTYPFNGKLG